MKKKKNVTLEEAMSRLEQIATLLESGQPGLDESIRLYEEGSQLVQDCRQTLDQAQARIHTLCLPPEEDAQEEDEDDA